MLDELGAKFFSQPLRYEGHTVYVMLQWEEEKKSLHHTSRDLHEAIFFAVYEVNKFVVWQEVLKELAQNP